MSTITTARARVMEKACMMANGITPHCVMRVDTPQIHPTAAGRPTDITTPVPVSYVFHGQQGWMMAT
eukprot:14058359-Alexandrium_andersonii.AAC.2